MLFSETLLILLVAVIAVAIVGIAVFIYYRYQKLSRMPAKRILSMETSDSSLTSGKTVSPPIYGTPTDQAPLPELVPENLIEESLTGNKDLPHQKPPSDTQQKDKQTGQNGDTSIIDNSTPFPTSEPLQTGAEESQTIFDSVSTNHSVSATSSGQSSPPTAEFPHEKSFVADPLPTLPTGPARYRDRRSARRAIPAHVEAGKQPNRRTPSLRQSDAKLRLYIDSNRKSIHLSIVLSRPKGFPDQIELDVIGSEAINIVNDEPVDAFFDDERYEDIDVDWTPSLLTDELRLLDTKQSLKWVRGARPFHLFAPVEGESGFLTVSTADIGTEHIIVCREEDVMEIYAIATDNGSLQPKRIQEWTDIPSGWAVLTGYTPQHSAPQAKSRFRPLCPDKETKIRLDGGMPVRNKTYAEGHAPRILIDHLTPNDKVFIGGFNATRQSDGSWIAPGFDIPGKHRIVVEAGPSLTYSVLPDPEKAENWQIWDAADGAAWNQIAVCGARIFTDDNSIIMACESKWNARAIGPCADVQSFVSRNDDVPAAIAILQFSPAFILLSEGPRRHQGKVIWQGRDLIDVGPCMQKNPDMKWVDSVRRAKARNLILCPKISGAESAWRSVTEVARRIKKSKI